jgi:chorismate mutase/prephenate dehydratase
MSETLKDLRKELEEADRRVDEAVAARQQLAAKLAALERDDRPDGRLRVGYQGGAGAYSYLAAFEHFADRRGDLDCVGFRTFREMTDAVEGGSLDYGMLPVENTTAGSINQAYDLLARANVAAVGEHLFHVEHCLVALEPVALSDLRRIASHPQALEQCSDFIATLPDCEVEAYVDTAMAVSKLVRDGDNRQAAIASREAARRHGLEILKRGIANQKENYTRFLVVAREPVAYGLETPCKTSLVFATRHEKGALARCLNLLAERDLNLTKLESRPRPEMPWQYLFYVDVEGNLAAPETARAVEELGPLTSFLKVLGSYPAHAARPPQH